MNAESVEQFITFLQDVAYQTHENASKLAALEQTLSLHQEVNGQYRESMGRQRFVPSNRCDRQKTAEILESLRQALLREQPFFAVATAAQAVRVRPRRPRLTANKTQLKQVTAQS